MNRRDFIKTGAVAAVAAAAQGVQAEGSPRVIRAAVVGCGGRGTGGGYKQLNEQDFYRQGALGNLLNAAKILRDQGVAVEVKPVAFADYFLEKAQGAAKKFGVDEKFAFGGANGYKKIMEMKDVDVVILTTPLNFRPRHTMAAIQAGKHVFAEKGVAVDAPGVRLMIEASKLAEQKHLTIVCGTQRRHQKEYRMVKKALDEGRLGTILGGEVYWNGAVPWVRPRTPEQSNKDYLCNNWLNFAELSGDHICEQHVHNIDVANWFLGRYPKSVVAFGARSRRVSGNQYDCFSGDFDYGDGVHIHSMCRQVDGCTSNVSELFRTEKAILTGRSAKMADGTRVELNGDFPGESPYVVEHMDMLDDPHLRLHGSARDDERHHQEREVPRVQLRLHAHARGLREGRRRADARVRRQRVGAPRQAVARPVEGHTVLRQGYAGRSARLQGVAIESEMAARRAVVHAAMPPKVPDAMNVGDLNPQLVGCGYFVILVRAARRLGR